MSEIARVRDREGQRWASALSEDRNGNGDQFTCTLECSGSPTKPAPYGTSSLQASSPARSSRPGTVDAFVVLCRALARYKEATALLNRLQLLVQGADGLVKNALWRFWLPESAVTFIDERKDNKVSRWVEQGWITVTDGEVIDYDVIENDITADTGLLRVADISYDEWSGEPDLIRPDKPERGKSGKRIDGVPTAAMAVGGWKLRGGKVKKSSRMMVLG